MNIETELFGLSFVTDNRKCEKCGQKWQRNIVTQEFTCFTHGRPDGSELEKEIWRMSNKKENSE